MSLDSRIEAVLNREASTVETPWPPPLEHLRVAGETEVRRRQARRRVVGVLAVALVVAFPAALLLTDRPDSTGGTNKVPPVSRTADLRYAELPVGAPPASLYCLDGVVRRGQDEVALANGSCDWPFRFAEAGDSAAVVDSVNPVVTLFTDHGLQALPVRADVEASPLVFSPDGELLAWVSRARVHGRQTIVLWDTARGVELKRAQAPTSDVLNLEGIDGSGRVYMTSVGEQTRDAPADRIWVWASRQDDGFRQVVGLGDFVSVADVPPDGLAVLKTIDPDQLPPRGPGAVGLAAWGTVTAGGEFVLGRMAAVRPVVWSPDRSRYVAMESLTVVSPTSQGEVDRSLRLRLPSDVIVVGSPSWESPQQVLVPVDPAGSVGVAILRCAADTGRCQVAATGQRNASLPGDDADNMS
jgi:hypothetical protein